MNTPATHPVNPNQTLVIFDYDGVLVDTEVIAVELDRQILSEHGWNLTREQVIEKFLGTPMITVQRELERYLGYSLGEDWIDTLTHRYQREFDQRLTAVAGIEHALNAIDSAGFRTCVASSGSYQKIEHSLTLCELYERFSGRIFSADDVARGKPAPDLFIHAATQMGYSPSHCVVVEDSAHGVTAARAAHMPVLGYAGGVTPEQQLKSAGATTFYRMVELPALISTISSTQD